ncbi:unnamed protein product, partial [Amoebophrya sp. A25]
AKEALHEPEKPADKLISLKTSDAGDTSVDTRSMKKQSADAAADATPDQKFDKSIKLGDEGTSAQTSDVAGTSDIMPTDASEDNLGKMSSHVSASPAEKLVSATGSRAGEGSADTDSKNLEASAAGKDATAEPASREQPKPEDDTAHTSAPGDQGLTDSAGRVPAKPGRLAGSMKTSKALRKDTGLVSSMKRGAEAQPASSMKKTKTTKDSPPISATATKHNPKHDRAGIAATIGGTSSTSDLLAVDDTGYGLVHYKPEDGMRLRSCNGSYV